MKLQFQKKYNRILRIMILIVILIFISSWISVTNAEKKLNSSFYASIKLSSDFVSDTGGYIILTLLLICGTALVITLIVKFINCCKDSERIVPETHHHKNSVPISGIANDGVTCYMNSALQLMASSEVFIKQIESKQNESDVINVLHNILRNLNEPGHTNIVQDVRKLQISVNWSKTGEQDTYNLLAVVLTAIENSLKKDFEANSKIKVFCLYFPLEIQTTLDGRTTSKEQYFLGLQLNLCDKYDDKKHPVVIKIMLKAFFQSEVINSDSNKDDDLSQKDSLRRCWTNKLPDVVILHIQANKIDENRNLQKPEFYIDYPPYLTGKDLMFPPEEDNRKFKLRGIIEHKGSISSGHYMAYRQLNNQWYKINDQHVQTISVNKLTPSPYVMLYENY